jgi:hypothetical protein
LGLNIAHELVHFFTGRILGDPELETPPRADDPPNRKPEIGEAGRYWEKQLLNYRIESYWDPNDSLGVKQAGALYAFSTGNAANRVTRVADAWVRKIVLFGECST